MRFIDSIISKALLSILIAISRSKHDAPPKKRSKIPGWAAFEIRYSVPETPGEVLFYILCLAAIMFALVTIAVYLKTAK